MVRQIEARHREGRLGEGTQGGGGAEEHQHVLASGSVRPVMVVLEPLAAEHPAP
ncbi:MAG: hypothetical protein ACH34U_06860 [Cyanobium sp.]